MVRPIAYQQYGIDEFPVGTNAVVAVISYTVSSMGPADSGWLAWQPFTPPPQGYDMEDAMILNRASAERGFAHATVYKSEVGGAGHPLVGEVGGAGHPLVGDVGGAGHPLVGEVGGAGHPLVGEVGGAGHPLVRR